MPLSTRPATRECFGVLDWRAVLFGSSDFRGGHQLKDGIFMLALQELLHVKSELCMPEALSELSGC
jgi:hypothetical protein